MHAGLSKTKPNYRRHRKEWNCPHCQGFFFFIQYKTGFWGCRQGCGYELNFNPEKFETTIAYVQKDTRP